MIQTNKTKNRKSILRLLRYFDGWWEKLLDRVSGRIRDLREFRIDFMEDNSIQKYITKIQKQENND